MATADQVRRTISPGSLPQGRRQEVEGQLQQVLGSRPAGGAVGGAGGGAPAGAPPSGGGPLAALISGGRGQSDLPVTQGLSVGPGGGPSQPVPDPGLMTRMVKLQLLATEARTPQIRQMARIALAQELKRGQN